MPSFDVVSNIDKHELVNAVDQANREVSNRFDFKGTNARIESTDKTLTLIAPTDFQLKQLDEVLRGKLAKRNVDIRCLDYKPIQTSLHEARQEIVLKQGIETEFAKKIVKIIKEGKLKVKASIQGEQVRVSGKKRDDLQEAIAMLREQKLELPLQFENFRD